MRVMLKEGGVTVLEWLVRLFNCMLYVVNSTSGLGDSMHG